MESRYFEGAAARFGGWEEKRNDRNKGDGILGASPFLSSRQDQHYSNSGNRSDERRIGRDGSNDPAFGDRQKYSKGYSDLDPLYHEPLQGDLEDDYLYTKSKERKMSNGNSDGLSEDVKQLMNSLGLSKGDMEELSRLPDCELSVNNLMHAIGDLRRKKSTPSHDLKQKNTSLFGRTRSSIKKEQVDYYDPEEPTDLNDRYSPTRSKSPRRLSDAFSNFQDKWYENAQDEKKQARSLSWKSETPRDKYERESEYRNQPKYKDDVFESRQRPQEDREGRSTQRKRPGTRWEEEYDRPEPKIQHRDMQEQHRRPPLEMQRPLPQHERRPTTSGLLGDPLQPNVRGLERLVARSNRDDPVRAPEKLSRFQPEPLKQDVFIKHNPPPARRSLPAPERKRDDGLYDDPVPRKRQSLQPKKPFINQALPIHHGILSAPSVTQNVVPQALLVPMENIGQSRQVLSAQMQALQVLESEAKMKNTNKRRDDRGGRKSVAIEYKFTKAEAATEAAEMRRAKGRVLYLRFKSDVIEEEDIVKLAEPFGKVTNILIVKPTGHGGQWYQGFLELEQFDCAAAMVEHYMPNPPRVKGVSVQTQRSKYQTLQLREDQMGRNLAEMIHNNKARRTRSARYSISPIRENNRKSVSKEKDPKSSDKKKAVISSSKDETNTKDDAKQKEESKKLEKKKEDLKIKGVEKPEKKAVKEVIEKSPEKIKSVDKKVKEKENSKNSPPKEIQHSKETTSTQKEVENALKNAHIIKKILKEDNSKSSGDVMAITTNIVTSLEKVLKQIKK